MESKPENIDLVSEFDQKRARELMSKIQHMSDKQYKDYLQYHRPYIPLSASSKPVEEKADWEKPYYTIKWRDQRENA